MILQTSYFYFTKKIFKQRQQKLRRVSGHILLIMTNWKLRMHILNIYVSLQFLNYLKNIYIMYLHSSVKYFYRYLLIIIRNLSSRIHELYNILLKSNSLSLIQYTKKTKVNNDRAKISFKEAFPIYIGRQFFF